MVHDCSLRAHCYEGEGHGTMPLFEFTFASGEDSLSVRRFSVHEVVGAPFIASIWARSERADLDLESLVGKRASFRIQSGLAFAHLPATRHWTGVCSYIEQVQVEPTGLSTYYLRLVPTLWLLTQRRNYRVFQHLSIPDIVDHLLGEWHLQPTWAIDRARYPRLEYKVQYGESDHAFLSRLLEEAGISFTFPDDEPGGTKLLLGDALHLAQHRAAPPVPWVDNPNLSAEREYVSHVRLAHEIRPAAHTVRDHDFRNPGFALFGKAAVGEASLHEQYHYRPGAFLIEAPGGAGGHVADDQGVARHDAGYGARRAEAALAGTRMGRRSVSFDTNVIGLRPGVIFTMAGHPHGELPEGVKLLVTELTMEGSPGDEWSTSGRAVFAAEPYRPPLATPKPVVSGVQSAIVVGPRGEEIHTDELGRVRVQFPWDREGKHDDHSSCWIRVSQGWAGTGFGMITIPRVGQEVLVGFIEGDPDQPIVVGRVFNPTEQVPYKLPEHKTRSTWKSSSSPGSGGSNEIMFEDAKGRELLLVHAERDLKKLVKHDETEVTQKNRHVTVGDNLTKLVMVDEAETTGADRTVTVGATLSETVGGDHKVSVGGSHTESVAQGMSLTVGPTPPPPGDAPAAKPPATPAGVMKIEAAERLEIVVGAATLTIDKSGKVTLNGVEFDFTATGPVQINGSIVDLN